jgi:HD-GYP domain-containing protein (c-di-GMP phosphodiesterase class II)
MGTPVRVLIIEDSEDDSLLVVRRMRQGDYDPDWLRVETAEAMTAALHEETWDLVLCDYKLPKFDGLTALEIFKDSGLDIPFILVSGDIGEEIAVEAMRAGAHDYIMKGNLARLIPAVERELREAASRKEKRNADQELQRSRALLESAGRMARFGGWSANLADMRVTWSDQVAVLHEVTPGTSLTVREWIEFIAPESRDGIARAFEECSRRGVPYDEEMEIITARGGRLWVRTTGKAVRDESGTIVGIQGAFQDITESKKNVEKLRKALGATIQAMAAAVETRDPYTAGHQRRVSDLARSIGAEMKLDLDVIDGLRMAASIHDIGKISVPAEILSKPTRLSNVEFDLIKTHSRAGFDILKDIAFPWPIARIVLEHHERINGSGYPNGTSGDELLTESKILAVADVVESMASHRPYRPSLGINAALEEISKNSGILYDQDVVEACLRLFREGRYVMTDDADPRGNC